MAVEVNSTRKAVEIAWEPMGQGEVEGPKPPDFPDYPVDPDYGIDEGAHPDQGLPGEQPRPDQGLPGEQPRPSHPIYLPPYIDNSLPGRGSAGGEHPDHELPEIGLSEEQKQKLQEFLTGNLPPYVHPEPMGGIQIAVQVFAEGQEGDWSNTAVMPNDGLAVLTFPEDFEGESYVEVRALDGSVVASGTITVD